MPVAKKVSKMIVFFSKLMIGKNVRIFKDIKASQNFFFSSGQFSYDVNLVASRVYNKMKFKKINLIHRFFLENCENLRAYINKPLNIRPELK
jgi:hypothetical protein